MYVFMVNIEAYKIETEAAIAVNGQEQAAVRADGVRTAYDDTCVVTVLQLTQNDVVSVVLKSGHTDGDQTMFFGCLIHET